MQWLNEPQSWREDDGILRITTGDRTDFWRETHYGFIRDDGHLRYKTVEGDFTAELQFSGGYQELYDQAGLMLRINERNWIKAGIEFVAGRQMLSVVVTRDFSDWSTAPAPRDVEWMGLRVSRHSSAVRVEWAGAETDGSPQLMRLAYLPESTSIQVGPMCCSPQRRGFEARFREFRVDPGVSADLH
jgi:regulation of enolase protein 1 (concanavalin A-like superfamily)